MERKIYNTSSLDDLPLVVKQFLKDWKDQRIFAFFGAMGAGKTTFIKILCKALQVDSIVTSPTFSIVNEYTTIDDKIIYHFDFYRIEDEDEVFDMGFEEYIDSGHICLMEWSENIEALLPENICKIHISEKENGLRVIVAENL